MVSRVILVVTLVFLAACQSEEPPPPPPEPVGRTPSPEGAMAYFVSPEDGQIFSDTTVQVVFGLDGMEVVPAGTVQENSGHHHLLLNVEEESDMNMIIPATSNHIHFGLAQTETVLNLSPGRHTLQLLLGDALHIPHDPPVMSEKITIWVQPTEEELEMQRAYSEGMDPADSTVVGGTE